MRERHTSSTVSARGWSAVARRGDYGVAATGERGYLSSVSMGRRPAARIYLQLPRQLHVGDRQAGSADRQQRERHVDRTARAGDPPLECGPVHEQAAPLQRLERSAETGKRARAADRLELLPALGAARERAFEPRDRLRLRGARRRIVADQACVLRRLDRRPKLGAGLGEMQLDDLAGRDARFSGQLTRATISAIAPGVQGEAVGPGSSRALLARPAAARLRLSRWGARAR